MNTMQRAVTALFFAASFTVCGMAQVQVNDSFVGTYSGREAPAIEADSSSGVRGSLGVPLENLRISNKLGKLVFLANGGFALLFGAFACFVASGPCRKPIRAEDPLGGWRSGNSVTSI
jgi:hypothetical protein